GRASLTLIGRPLRVLPSSALMAAWAAVACDISTKAMPRGVPVSRSTTIVTVSTTPCAAKTSRTCCSVAVTSRFPTKILVKLVSGSWFANTRKKEEEKVSKRRSQEIAFRSASQLLKRLYVLSLPALGALRHVKLHR